MADEGDALLQQQQQEEEAIQNEKEEAALRADLQRRGDRVRITNIDGNAPSITIYCRSDAEREAERKAEEEDWNVFHKDDNFRHRFRVRRVKMAEDVTSIGEGRMAFMSNLVEVDFGSVTDVGNYACFSAYKLQTLHNFEGAKSIGDWAFWACYALESLVVPASVETMGCRAFANCVNLKEVILEEGVQEIGEEAFMGCFALKKLKVPKSVKRIGKNAFDQCTALVDLELPHDNRGEREKTEAATGGEEETN